MWLIITRNNRFQSRREPTPTPLQECHWNCMNFIGGPRQFVWGGAVSPFAPYWLHIFVCSIHIKTSQNSVYMLSVAVARSSSNESALRYVLPILWMTSFSHKTAHVVYGEAYGRGMSVIGRQRREGRSFSASAPPLSALPPAD